MTAFSLTLETFPEPVICRVVGNDPQQGLENTHDLLLWNVGMAPLEVQLHVQAVRRHRRLVADML